MKRVFKSEAGKKVILELHDAVISRWPVAHDTLTVPTRHGDTFVISSGDRAAQPLVLLHGATSNATSWVGDIETYASHFRVHAVDIPGEPGRSAPNRLGLDGPEYAQWLGDLLDGLGIERTHLAGLSQGGWTALRFATISPGRVSRLVLLAPGGIVATRPLFLARAVFLSFFGLAGGRRLNRIVGRGQSLAAEALTIMDAMMKHTNPRMDREYLFTDRELERLAMPILFVGGGRDVVSPTAKAAERIAALAPHVEVRLINGAGHALVNMAEQIIPFLNPTAALASSDPGGHHVT